MDNTFYYIDTDEIPGFFLLLKNHIFIARGEDNIFLSFTCEDIGVAMVTNMISQLQESFPFLIEFSKFSRQTELLQTLWNRVNIFIFSLIH